MTQPAVYMIAGPNGAGKTTAAMKLLPDHLGIHEFVNADEIAHGLNPLNAEGQAVAAGRVMLQRLDSLIAARKSFAFETTGASHAFTRTLQQAKTAGYRLGLLYLWLPNAEFAKDPVRFQVVQGGHHIPDKDVERRFGRGLANLVKLYLPMADEAFIFESTFPNTEKRSLILGKKDGFLHVSQPDLWAMIERIAKEIS